mgnify:CR=1 FL=1
MIRTANSTAACPQAGHELGARAWPVVCVILISLLSPFAIAAGDPADPVFDDNEELTLNFKGADIHALIATVSELTGRNFVVDPRVKGTVTVVSSAPTRRDALYDVFLSILKVHGFTAIVSGDVTKIVPDVNAKMEAGQVAGGSLNSPGDEVVTVVVPLEHVQAVNLVPILRPLLPQQAHLAAQPDSNMLVVADSAANVERLLRVVRRLDRRNTQDIEIIRLEHAEAEDVVALIDSIESANRGVPEVKGQAQLPVVADPRTNSIMLGGDSPIEKSRLRALISHLDTPVVGNETIEVIYLKYATAADLVPVLQGVATGGATSVDGTRAKAKKSGGTSRDVHVQADAVTNALIIQAPPDVMRTLKIVTNKLDIRRAQVLVEGVIAEVTSAHADELGVQWQTNLPSDGIVASTRFPGRVSGPIDSPFDPGDVVGFLDGLTVGYLSGGDLRTLIRALSGDQFANVLSTPSLVTLDNSEAEIVVGQNVPFITGQFTNNATTPDNPFQTIERQDIGILLRVRPQINEGDTVALEISQEISSIAADTVGSDLITNKRSILTNVLVDNRQTVVLGGLISDDLQENTQKIPLLGDLPLIGELFRNSSSDIVKRNLMVFLRPTIMRDKATNVELSGRQYEHIRGVQIEHEQRGGRALLHRDGPILPEFDGLLE